MSSKRLKVPSSARRHIKYDTFSSFVSATRLRRVQNILVKHEKATGKMDGILCITGIDSRYNEGMSEFLHYLLFGFFEVRKKELESSGFSEEIIDDLMIFIRSDRVEIYCNPVNYHYLLPYVSHWPSVQFHCLPEDKYEGEEDDAAEEFKIYSIIAMVSQCTCVGIPFSGRGQNVKFDIMAVEKWPIIQAFALDDFGGGGFFTLKHEVVDISEDVHLLSDYQDPVTVEILLTQQLPLLHKQWDTMIKSVDLSLASNKAFLSHRKISEPFSSYFNHGMVGHKRSHGQIPFVAFSKDTDASKLKKLHQGDAVNFVDLPLNKTSEMEHVICQVVSPHSPLMCTRTYFFGSHFGYRADGQGDGHGVSRSDDIRLRYTMTIYLSMVQAVLSAIDVYSQTASFTEAKNVVLSCLEEGTQHFDNGQLKRYFSNSSNIDFKIEIQDTENRNRPVEESKNNPLMKCSSLFLYNVPALDQGGDSSIGSLAFSETFLDSRIFLEGSSSVSSDFLVLTSTIPRIHLWSMPVPGNVKPLPSVPTLPVDMWGNPLATQEDIGIFPVWNALLPPIKMTVTAWEKGITAQNSSFSGFALHSSHIKSIALYDGDSMEHVCFLIVELQSGQETLSSIPPHLCIPENWEHDSPMKIVLAFNPHTKGHTKLYGQVLPVWKENVDLPSVERLEFLDYSLEEIHEYLQQKVNSAKSANTQVNGLISLKKLAGQMPNLNSFLDHLTCSSRVDVPVKRDVFNTFTGSSFNSEDGNDDHKIVVTIIAGAPGSEKNSLSSLITTFNNNVINWLVYKQPEECSVNKVFLHRSMVAAVQSRDQWMDSKRTRVILVAPGFCDTSDVIRILFSHPDPKVSSQFRIGNVNLCIDPVNTFMENKMTLPMLTAQCAQGWVNTIIFTSQTLAPSDLLDDLQELIRSINPDIALLKAENAEVKRSTDLDLVMSETAFDDPEKAKARALIKPFWPNGPPYSWASYPAMTDVVLKFSHPLEKHLLLIKLRGIRSSHKSLPFDGNIYYVRGFLSFSSSSTVMEVQFSSLSGKLIMNESRSQDPSQTEGSRKLYIMSFTGIGLKENTLKEFLSTCVKQKPEKKNLITRKDVPKHEIERLHENVSPRSMLNIAEHSAGRTLDQAAHRLDELPEGWYYNGSQFVSMEGERSRTHPNLDEFVDAYVAKKNADIAKYNASIDTQTYVNLFP